MTTAVNEPDVLQLRIILEADDFDAAVTFYRDVLGLTEQAAFEGEGDARVAILEAGRATLEIANPGQRRLIDEIEVGRYVGSAPRLAFEVRDTRAKADELAAAGASVIGTPVETPWRSLNARLGGPGDMQLTLFEELESLEERSAREGFGTAGRRDAD